MLVLGVVDLQDLRQLLPPGVAEVSDSRVEQVLDRADRPLGDRGVGQGGDGLDVVGDEPLLHVPPGEGALGVVIDRLRLTAHLFDALLYGRLYVLRLLAPDRGRPAVFGEDVHHQQGALVFRLRLPVQVPEEHQVHLVLLLGLLRDVGVQPAVRPKRCVVLVLPLLHVLSRDAPVQESRRLQRLGDVPEVPVLVVGLRDELLLRRGQGLWLRLLFRRRRRWLAARRA